jgi:hypothetical protein
MLYRLSAIADWFRTPAWRTLGTANLLTETITRWQNIFRNERVSAVEKYKESVNSCVWYVWLAGRSGWM